MTTLTNPDGTPWEPPTAEELLARGDVAVKREFLRLPLPPPPPPPPPADEAGVRGDGGSDKNRTGKSRKQLARERQAARDAGAFVCNAYIKGECTYGDKCRYGHDINAYILSKQPDLPGPCPFVTARGECPHGVTCRFYGAHPPPVPEAAAKCPRVSPEALAALDDKRTPEDARTLPLPLPKDDIPEERNASPPSSSRTSARARFGSVARMRSSKSSGSSPRGDTSTIRRTNRNPSDQTRTKLRGRATKASKMPAVRRTREAASDPEPPPKTTPTTARRVPSFRCDRRRNARSTFAINSTWRHSRRSVTFLFVACAKGTGWT